MSFKLPEEIKKDLAKYKSDLADLTAGKIPAARFKGVRVPWGFYSHRGGEIFMSRVRVPAGVLSPAQLKALAEAAEKYGQGQLHITTRHDIQIHQVKIEDTPALMDYLLPFDLSPRGGGGNTVRNITACELSGCCQTEVFDVRPDAIALTEQLLSEENSFTLPRKYKIAFTACERGWRSYLMNDLGFLAKVEEGRRGYRVFVGGGMGAISRAGQELHAFIETKEVGRVAEAVKSVFNKYGNRKNRHHNRLRFLIEDLGFEKFQALYQEELAKIKLPILRQIRLPESPAIISQVPESHDVDFQHFIKYSYRPQKQAGYASIELRIPQGDISSDQLKQLAGLGQEFRASMGQNLIVSWIKNEQLEELFSSLRKILPDFLFPRTLLDVVACKGAATCNLGICNSPALAKEIEKMINENYIDTEAFRKLDIKLNGCANACGQHPLGKIALHGLVKRLHNRPVPFYKILIGAKKVGDSVQLSEPVGEVPARRVVDFLKALISAYPFSKETAAKLTEQYSEVPLYEGNREYYVDWGRTEDFSLAGIGPGECGAGVIDMIESDLKEAQARLDAKDYFRSLVLSARALLIVKGLEPKTEPEVFSNFKTSFVEEGIVDHQFKEINQATPDNLKPEYAQALNEAVKDAYARMDSNFKFHVTASIEQASEQIKVQEKQISADEVLLDLKGVACPMNFVKAKLKLETLGVGAKLLVYLDDGDPINNVPASFLAEGQKVLQQEKVGEYWAVLIEKTA